MTVTKDHEDMQLATAPSSIEHRIAQYSAELLAFLRRRTAVDAEELAQETWLRVARANPDCPSDASFRAYAYTVARRVLIDHHRRRHARIQLVGMEPEPMERLAGRGHGPDADVAAGQILDRVELTLRGMKPELAQVFRWRVHTDLSFKDIAARQGVPLNTALGRMHRATKLLANALERAGLTPTRGTP